MADPLILPPKRPRTGGAKHDDEAQALPVSRKISGYCNEVNKGPQHELCDGIVGSAPKVYRCPCPCHSSKGAGHAHRHQRGARARRARG